MTYPDPSLSSTQRLLLQLVRAAWDPPEQVASGDAVPDADWTEAVRLALDHGTAGLLCRGLQRLSDEAIPAGMAEAAGTYLAEAETQGRARIANLFTILDMLAGAGIGALAYKGPALATLAYDCPWIRPSRDLDVIVARSDMKPAIAALARLGYRSEHDDLSPRVTTALHDYAGQDILFAEGRMPVEPHCAFTPAALAVRIDMEGIRARARTIVIDDREIATLGVEDTILTACLHIWKSRRWRLLCIADVAALLHCHPGVDWDALAMRARDAGLRRVLHLGLALAHDLFEAPLPDRVARAVAAERSGDWLLRESMARLFVPSHKHLSRYHLLSRERGADRLRYLWRTVTTPNITHFRMLRLPGVLFGGYFALKLARDYVARPLWHLTGGPGRRARVKSTDTAA